MTEQGRGPSTMSNEAAERLRNRLIHETVGHRAVELLDEALATRQRLTVERLVERYGLPGTADSIEDVHRDLATADVDEEAAPPPATPAALDVDAVRYALAKLAWHERAAEDAEEFIAAYREASDGRE